MLGKLNVVLIKMKCMFQCLQCWVEMRKDLNGMRKRRELNKLNCFDSFFQHFSKTVSKFYSSYYSKFQFLYNFTYFDTIT